jgi:hypothetical protein
MTANGATSWIVSHTRQREWHVVILLPEKVRETMQAFRFDEIRVRVVLPGVPRPVDTIMHFRAATISFDLTHVGARSVATNVKSTERSEPPAIGLALLFTFPYTRTAHSPPGRHTPPPSSLPPAPSHPQAVHILACPQRPLVQHPSASP